jgi:hypothetical protein
MAKLGRNQRVRVSLDLGQQVVEAQASRRPDRMGTKHRVAVAEGGRQGLHDRRIPGVADVAEDYQGVTPYVAGLTPRYVPTADRFEQGGIWTGQNVQDIEPGL